MNRKVLCKLLLIFSALGLGVLSNAEPIWIDVRSVSEYNEDHIDGDTFIPHEQIVQQVSELFPDKSSEIHLYCRSGGRAGRALNALEEAGYTNVFNAGGIDDAREQRDLDGQE